MRALTEEFMPQINSRSQLFFFSMSSLLIFFLNALSDKTAYSEEKPPEDGQEISCPEDSSIAPTLSRSQTYLGLPYQPGEEARYELKYSGVKVHVGYGTLRVEKPVKYDIAVGKQGGKVIEGKRWHRVFSAEGYTGDWYKMIFAAHDKIQSFSRPWDYGASKFYISQDEKKPFSTGYRRDKWLEFDHVRCEVNTREHVYHKDKKKEKNYPLQPTASDALSVLYQLRASNFKVGETLEFLVHTSEKNWWLKATPVKEELVTVKAGNFNSYKLDLKTYLGEDLQQKGDWFVWIAKDHPNRPMVKVEAEVTFGQVYIELDRYKAGIP
jgi:hypothetical protein